MVKKKFVLNKTKTNTLEKEIKLLKGQKPIQKICLAQIIPAINTSLITSINKLKKKKISQV